MGVAVDCLGVRKACLVPIQSVVILAMFLISMYDLWLLFYFVLWWFSVELKEDLLSCLKIKIKINWKKKNGLKLWINSN